MRIEKENKKESVSQLATKQDKNKCHNYDFRNESAFAGRIHNRS